MAFLDSPDDLHESQTLEFKEASGGLPDDLWETYSAFANTEGGKIVLGVREDEPGSFSPVGVQDPRELESEFWKTVRNQRRVEKDVMLYDGVATESTLGVRLLVISVPRAERGTKPVRVYDRRAKAFVAYLRRGESDVVATDSDLRLMTYDGVPGADRAPLEGYDPEALCGKTIARYRSAFLSSKPLSPWNVDPEEDFLYHIGALARGRDGLMHPTQAGLLAFGWEYEITSYLPHYLLDYREESTEGLRWDDRVVSQDSEWSGNVIDFYLTVSGRLARRFRMPFSTNADGTRHGSRNPATEAANEALVNALAHAYYGGTGSVRVVLRPDRLEVSNPGSMLVDRRVAIAGGFSEARNPTLMRIFSLIGASDRAGSGLCEIWSTWGSLYGSAPVLEERHSPSCVTLSLPLPAGAGAAAPATDPSASVLEAVSGAEGGLTPSEAFGAGLYPSVRTAQKQMRALFDAGLVSRRRDGRSWRYLSRR